MAVTVYGISNCDQVRKTLGWLRDNEIEFRFHDFRADGIERAMLERWCTHLPWNSLLNRRGLTWRSLDDSLRAQAVDQTSAIEHMLAHPTLIKRPVVEIADRLLLGYSAERLAAALLPAEAQGSGS
jgi:Spx/MgsR family transcriptional regulator